MIDRLTDKFKGTLTRSTTAAVVALGLAFAPAANVSAEQPTMQKTAVTQSIRVPMRDARGAQEDGVQASAAAISKDSQVIVFFGDNYEAYKATVQAAKEIIAEGTVPLRGIILADPLTPQIVNGYKISGSQEIELYADGQLTDTIESPTGKVKGLIKQRLQEDYENIIIPRRTLAAASPDLAAN